MGEDISLYDIDDQFKRLDSDSDGFINFLEYCHHQSNDTHISPAVIAQYWDQYCQAAKEVNITENPTAVVAERVAEVTEEFKSIDENQDGVITKDEITQELERMGAHVDQD